MVSKVFKNKSISTFFNIMIHALFTGYMVLPLLGFPVIGNFCLLLLLLTYLPVVYKANKLNKLNQGGKYAE